LTTLVYALDKAGKSRSKDLLKAITTDLQLKQEDCEARGPNAAGNDVDFHVTTVNFPNQPVPGWIVRFRHVLDLRSGPWERFSNPTDASRSMPPGPYRMYVERPDTGAKSCVETIGVSFRNKSFSFLLPTGSAKPCQVNAPG
jgi:hypothetical protein